MYSKKNKWYIIIIINFKYGEGFGDIFGYANEKVKLNFRKELINLLPRDGISPAEFQLHEDKINTHVSFQKIFYHYNY